MEQFDWFNYVLLPILIGLARIFDVTVGTLRIIFVSKGKKHIAPILGFIEVLAWIIVIGEIMKSANNLICYVGYACGFAVGNYVGMLLEEKLAIGNLIVRVIVSENQRKLKDEIMKAGYGMTIVPAYGAMGHPVDVLFMAIERSHINKLVDIIKTHAPNAFYSIEEAKYVKEGHFYNEKYTNPKKGFAKIIFFWRPGK